jgi:hypothetical protein
MITCKLLGGLGNQLFIIFASLSYSIQHKQHYFFEDTSQTIGMTHRNTYWKTIFNKLMPYLLKKESFPFIDIIIKENNYFINLPENKNILLCDYFQSIKYFKDNYSTIIKLLDIENQKKILLNENKFYSQQMIDKCISIHFRIGDYINIQDYHNILPFDYYKKALEYILTNINYNPIFLYFCEEKDIIKVNKIILSLKNHFPKCIFQQINDSFLDWEQLLLMSCCKHNIIANSTFSWWGAYFNSNPEKIVCYPAQWFGDKNTYCIDDLFPEKWNKISF